LRVADVADGGEDGGECWPQRAGGIAPYEVERESERLAELEQSHFAVGSVQRGADGESDAAFGVTAPSQASRKTELASV